MPASSSNLPVQPTPFVGRQEELTAITRLLADPACRLLTLVGPGGIGKTRLAIQAATTMLDDFTRGVFFVNLQPIRSTEFLISTIADALNFHLSGQEPPPDQLGNYLADKEIFLLLDSFEHLLDGCVMLSGLLQSAPKVKFLITSQEALNLQEEWLYPIGGMQFPASGYVGDISAYSGVQLFSERALRMRPNFSLDDNRDGVVRICQLVEGMPLALELAASWTKTLDCATIADEIQENLNFLTTSLRNVPQRHRSMQAIFDQTWKLLTERERQVFKRLSVFRGGFDRQAARYVTGASLSVLSVLVDKSLLRWDSHGRYQVHGLLRQYAEERLALSPEDVIHIRDLHCAYYANFLYQRRDDLMGGRQRDAIAEAAVEVDNLRVAWQWATERAKIEEIQKMAHPFTLAFQAACRYLEMMEALKDAVQSLTQSVMQEQADRALAGILVDLGWIYIRVGRLEEAEATLEQSLAVYRRLNIPPVPGQGTDPLLPLGIIASVRGDYPKATRLGEQALQTSETQNHPGNRQFAHYVLSSAALARGDYEDAQRQAQAAFLLTQETQDRWFMAYCLNEMGNAAYALGDYTAAKGHYEASYAIREEFDDPEGMAVALNHLGEVALRQQAYSDAEQFFHRSVAIYQDLNDRGGLATALQGLGNTNCALRDYHMAQQRFHRAMELARDIQFIPLIISLLVGIGELYLHSGQAEKGMELLALASHHPASGHEIKTQAQQALQRYQGSVPQDRLAAAIERGQECNLDAVVETTLLELVALDISIEAASLGTSLGVRSSAQPLIDPLTERELEVLHLIAQGLTNRQIADTLIISPGTAKWYTSQIYSKLHVKNRTQAVAHARELKLLPAES